MLRILKRFKSSAGIGTLESILALGILGVVVAGGTAIGVAFLKANRKSVSVASIIQMRKNIIDAVRSSDSLAKISDDPLNAAVPNIACLKTQQNCGVASTGLANFSVVDSGGNYLTQHSTANFGFGLDLLSCTTYPSNICPFRYSVRWRSYCDAGFPETCVTPQLAVTGILSVAPGFDEMLDVRNFNFNTTLHHLIGTYEQGCTSIGGIYIASTPPRCSLPGAGDCPLAVDGSKQLVVGFNSVAKTKTCKPYFQNALNGVSCLDGQVMQAIDAAGNPICKNIVAAPPPGLGAIPYCDKFPTDPVCLGVIYPSIGDGGADGGCGDGGGGAC